MSQEKCVAVGATSKIGKKVADDMEAKGFEVCRVSRSQGFDIRNPDQLNDAFNGATLAYLMIPFDRETDDLRASEQAMCEALTHALRSSNVKRVVLLSGLNAHLKMGTSLGTAVMEDSLETLEIAEWVSLRAGFFMENFTEGMGFVEQASQGVFATPFRGDRPVPLIASEDIATRVVELLTTDHFPTGPIAELHGSELLTLEQATTVLGNAMGHADLSYHQVDMSDARQGMLQAGISNAFIDALAETVASFNSGETWPLEAMGPGNTTPTTLHDWAVATFNS